MLSGFIVLFGIPIFLIVLISNILYDLYRAHTKHKKLEKRLKKKYPLAYKNK